jgi:hypothetical protein
MNQLKNYMEDHKIHTDCYRKINKFKSRLIKSFSIICIIIISMNYYNAFTKYYTKLIFPEILKYYTEANMLIITFFIIIYFFIMKEIRQYYIQNQ